MEITREPLGSLPAHTARTFAEIGPVWGSDINRHRDFVIAAYAPLVSAAPKDGIDVARERPYGAHPRQVLDVFAPRDAVPALVRGGAAPARDVVVFVHGGAFVRGKKSINGEIYDNVCYWFARQGLVAVNVEYRLASDAPYPGGAQDVALALDWVGRHSGEFNANPARVFLIGHSAGGSHAATYLFDPAFAHQAARQVAGLILVSARLRADTLPDNPNAAGVRAYYGDDPAQYDSRSPVTHAANSAVPLMIAVAEFENPRLDLYGCEFFERTRAARSRAPRFIQMARHNHTSIVAHFNSGEETLGPEILAFMATV